MRKFVYNATLLALLLGSVCAFAQTEPMKSPHPKYLNITREEVKGGKDIAHNAHEVAWTKASLKAGNKVTELAMTSMTGPAEGWFLFGYETMAELEKSNMENDKNPALAAVNAKFLAGDSEYVNRYYQMIARRNDELSYHPGFNVGDYRYFSVNIVRVKVGHGSEYADIVKIMNAAREKAGMDIHTVVYNVISGAPFATYIVFVPRKSLGDLDETAAGKRYDEALGDEGSKRIQQLADSAGLTVDTRMLSFMPAASNLPKEVVAAAPDYWAPKTTMAKAKAAAPEMAMKEKATPAKKVTPTATAQKK